MMHTPEKTTKLFLVGFLIIIIILGAVRIWTHRKATQNAPMISSPITQATYSCDKGKTIAAAYYEGPAAPELKSGEPPTPTGWVEVSIGGAATTTLHQTISADGTRYANDDESLVFWSKGNTALIMRDNSMDLNYTNCTAE